MALFYGTLNARGYRNDVTKCGNKCMRASAQSYDGSIITEVYYDDTKQDGDKDKLRIRIELSNYSDTEGSTYFDGTMKELKAILKGDNNG